MSTISRAGLPKPLYNLFKDITDVRALAKSTAETFLKNSAAMSKTIKQVLDYEDGSANGYLYTLDGGIYNAEDVRESLNDYLENGEELNDITALNDLTLKHNSREIIADSKSMVDINNVYANAYTSLSNADYETDSVKVSEFNALNEACGVAIDTLYGYYNIASVISDTQYTLTDKYMMLMQSVDDQVLRVSDNRLITDFDSSQFGLCPLAAWGIEFLSKIIDIDFSTIANTLLSMVRTCWNAIAYVGHAIENAVANLFNKYVFVGDVFDLNLSASKPNYLSIPVMQYTFDNDIPIFSEIKTFSSFSQRCLYSIITNMRQVDIGVTVENSLTSLINQANIRFIILKFGIIGVYNNPNNNKVECVVYLIPSDSSEIRNYLPAAWKDITTGSGTVEKTVPYFSIYATVSNGSGSLTLNGSAMFDATADRLYKQSINSYIHDLLSNTNLADLNHVDDKSVYSGLMFSHYKMNVLLNYISNYDLIQEIANETFNPTLTSYSGITTGAQFLLPPDWLQQMLCYYVSILMLHGSNHFIKVDNNETTYNYSMNNYDNDWVDDAIRYGLMSHSVDEEVTPTVATFVNNFMQEVQDITNSSVTMSASPSGFDASFVVFSTTGQSNITDSLAPTFLPSVGYRTVQRKIAICFLLCYIIQNGDDNSYRYAIPWTDFGRNMIVIPSVSSMNSIVHPGISLLTNSQQASRFRGVLLTVAITTAIIGIGVAIGNTVIAFRSNVLKKNIDAQSKYLNLSRLNPGTSEYEIAKQQANQAINTATRWNSFAQAIGGTSVSSTSMLSGLVKNDDVDSKLNKIISLINS